ncbi:MAG: putative heme transporter, partial [Actinomycetota bacterium]|nr:putative heme transporter [Actinomycetota bacterium]
MTKPIKRVLLVLALFLVIEYLVLPQIGGLRNSLSLLDRVNVGFVALGAVLELLALISYAKLTQAVLPPDSRLGLWSVFRIDLSTLAVSHVLPGGAAAGTGLGYRLLVSAGVRGPDAGFALATQGIGSAVVLNVLLWLGLVVSIPLRGFDPLYGTAAIVGVIVIGGFSTAVLLLMRGEERAADLLCRIATRLPLLDGPTVRDIVHRLAARLRDLAADRGLVARAIFWATANWVLDAASLWVFVWAFGFRVGVDGLIVAYGLAYVLAAIPITPGGLGVVEAVLTSSLVGFGAPRAVAILGVISYRLLNFWLPIPLGGL